MATYCGKCGSEVPSDKQFCATCGTPVAASAQPPAYAPVSSGAPGGGYTPIAPVANPVGIPFQMAPPPAKSGGALKIILIVVAIVVGLGILGVGAIGFTAWRIAHAFHVSGSGRDASISVPGGTITTNSSEIYTASDLGTDIYPGARPGRGSMRMSLPTGSVITAIYETSDSKEQVVNYYKGRLGSESSVFDSGDGAVLSVQKGKQESIMVTISANPQRDEGKTKIAIMHTKTNKAD